MVLADLSGATKQLTEDALLDIIQLPDAGSYACRQLLIDVGVSTQGLQQHSGQISIVYSSFCSVCLFTFQ